jgi:hypothetical protein
MCHTIVQCSHRKKQYVTSAANGTYFWMKQPLYKYRHRRARQANLHFEGVVLAYSERSILGGVGVLMNAHYNLTSLTLSTIVWTLLCRGANLTLYGRGVRPERPSYSSREIGAEGTARTLKAHRMREMASQSSRSATTMPGHRRLPAPKVQWSLSITLMDLAESAQERLSPI